MSENNRKPTLLESLLPLLFLIAMLSINVTIFKDHALDGSNQIIFNRSSGTNEFKNQIYLIDPNGEVGSEVLVSEPGYPHCEWAYSGLIDGNLI